MIIFNMELKIGDTIYIKGFKDENPEFYCWKHMKDLIDFPTRVFLIRNDTIYVTHPTLDVVPLSEDCVDYEVLGDINLGYHRDLKKNFETLKSVGVKKIPKEKISKIFNRKNIKEDIDSKLKRNIEIVQKITNDDEPESYIEKLFNGIDNFISWVKKNNLEIYVDPFNSNMCNYTNKIFYMMYEKNPDFIWDIIDNELMDVREEDEKFYFRFDSDNIPDIFNTNDEDLKNELIDIIRGLNIVNAPINNSINIFNLLTNESKQILKNFILSEEAENIDYQKINSTKEELPNRINDDLFLELVINEGLPDLKNDLIRTYGNCYEDLLSEEQEEKVFNSLIGKFIDSRDEVVKKGNSSFGSSYTRYIDASECIYNSIEILLNHIKDKRFSCSKTRNTFRNYSNILQFLISNNLIQKAEVPKLPYQPNQSELLYKFNREIFVDFS